MRKNATRPDELSEPRLTASIEIDSLVRRAQQAGGFGAVLRKGDGERGSIIMLIVDRGSHVACLERQLQMDGSYRWAKAGPTAGSAQQSVEEWTEKRVKFDEDLWLIELDIPQPERFIVDLGVVG